MKQPTEDWLVLEAQAGNVQALGLLYQRYNPALVRFAFRLCSDDQLALDSVQEAWITLSKTLKKLKDPRGFRVWAYRTVRWRITDEIRKRGIETEPLHETEHSSESTTPDATAAQLKTLLNRLSAEDKHTLTLFYLNELTLIEIAAVLEVPIGTVKSRLNRARNQLRQHTLGETS